MAFYGLDFGTTNSSISIMENDQVRLLPIDEKSKTQEVVRSALYFFPKKIVLAKNVTEQQKANQTFRDTQISYEGATKTLIGTAAVNAYLQDNKLRHPGIRRKIYTGKLLHLILYVTSSGKQVFNDVLEFYEEIDFGTGRFFHALKSALKVKSYRGSRVFGEEYSLEQLIAKLISQIKDRADEMVKLNIDSVVVGRPVAISTDPDKDKAAQDRLEEALKIVGFKNIKFVFEPIAAAKYFLNKSGMEKKKILVFDFGGGTLDTALVEYDEGFNVLATDGVYIGGDLLNSDILYQVLGKYFGTEVTWGEREMPMPIHIVDSIRSWYAIPTLNNPDDIAFLSEKCLYNCNDPEAIKRLIYLVENNLGFEVYEAIERAKKELTHSPASRIVFKDGLIDIDIEITREQFEKIIHWRVENVRETVLNTLTKANLKPEDVDCVVRTGGSSLIPVFVRMLTDIFGPERITEFDPFTSVAAGLAIE